MVDAKNIQYKQITRILIANRGEIACRIIRSAQKMGIQCIAIYSDADQEALHVKLADEAWRAGASPAKDSYLDTEKIIDIAKRSHSDAIHPGYGFLSENSEFAALCKINNIRFIGPSEYSIKSMGSKSKAKAIMSQASVPLVPGYHGSDQTEEKLVEEAGNTGFPLLIKASSGGGGKGMRIVENINQFVSALSSCKREALNAFNNDDVLLEKYLVQPRHIEIQIFIDHYGNAVHLFERDCSVQRRHQKVIEEAPAPGIPDEIRNKMGLAAIEAARAIDYHGAGTVEFLYDHSGSFYFMEMNTRLQVEHPVTEMITGIDLVEWQIMVASGLPLPCLQDDLTISGHAFEARIYAENPANDFLPVSGKINYLSFPVTSQHVRIDSGITSGDSIGVFYDPMIAKLIVHDENRHAALSRLRGALTQIHVGGITTNIEFLHQLASNESFINACVDTHFIQNHEEELFSHDTNLTDEILVAAGLISILTDSINDNDTSQDLFSPWNDISGWRLNEDNYHTIKLSHNNVDYPIVAHFRAIGFLFEIDGKEYQAKGEINGNKIHIEIEGHQSVINFYQHNDEVELFRNASSWKFKTNKDPLILLNNQEPKNLTAPMPGTIVDVLVNTGEQVTEGQALIVMEAMKMEHTITAHKNTIVLEVLYDIGDLVEEGQELITFEGEE